MYQILIKTPIYFSPILQWQTTHLNQPLLQKQKKSEPPAFVLVWRVKWLKRCFSSELPFFQHSQPPYSLNPTTTLTL